MNTQNPAPMQPADLSRIPPEIWRQIARSLPAVSLPKFVLSCRTLYRCAISNLYCTVYFYGTKRHHSGGIKALSDRASRFGAHREQFWLSDPSCSSRIINLEGFIRTIEGNRELKFYISGASFGWVESAILQEIFLAKRCLELLNGSTRLLHIDIPDMNIELAVTSNVAFLEIEYPEWYEEYVYQGFRDQLYSIFAIPTLRILSFSNARAFDEFEPLPPFETWRVGTSNVVSLSLINTIPLLRDLEEMLTWPHALRHYHHENAEDGYGYFQNYSHEIVTSPQVFIEGLQSQRRTIEELVYNNEEDRRGHDMTTFGKTLRQFTHLKRLSVPVDCLILDWEDQDIPLYQTLPPNLEQAWLTLSYEDFWDDVELPYIIHGLREIAMNKEQWFPSLTTLFLWRGSLYDPNNLRPEANEILDIIGLNSEFKDAGIVFDLKLDIDFSDVDWKTQ